MSLPQPAQILQQAVVHHQAGRFKQAQPLYQQVQRLAPKSFDAWHLGGTVSLQLNRPAEAIPQLLRALALQPRSALCLMRLGVARAALDELDAAVQMLQRAAVADPKVPETWEHLAVVERRRGRLPDALSAAEQAARLRPSDHAAFARVIHLVCAHQGISAALPRMQEAVRRWPTSAEAWKDLGTALANLHEADEALVALDRALALNPMLVSIQLGRALALQEAGRIAEAVLAYELVLSAEPAHPEAGSARLLCLNYSDTTNPGAMCAAHLAYGRAQAPTPPAALPRRVRAAGKPLRVAVVSPDLRRHAVAQFFEPLLAHLPADQIEIWLYHDHPVVDAVSDRLRARAAQWRHIAGHPHDLVAATLRADAPDVLLDLTGHTGFNRLPVYANRVAPVQISYLGYPKTTGLSAMDYRFTDALADPLGKTDAFHTERLVRFSACAWTFLPPADAPNFSPPSGTREAGRGPVFGSFNNPAKLTDFTLRLWARVLQAVPDSRLLLKGHGLETPARNAELRQRCAAAGLDPARVELIGRTPGTADHLSLYQRVDIALDPFPYHGTTTTCEALWMGRPVVSLAGVEHRSRVGVSLLHAAGHPEWAVDSEEAYIRMAAYLGTDLVFLKRLASGLRNDLAAGPLLDHAGQSLAFVRALLACHDESLSGAR